MRFQGADVSARTDRAALITRAQAFALRRSCQHLRDMTILALAAWSRRSNITGLEWSRVDSRATAFIPATSEAPEGDCRAVSGCHRRGRALETRAVRVRGEEDRTGEAGRDTRLAQARTAAGVEAEVSRPPAHLGELAGAAESSHLQELGGWASFSMVQRYAHLSPGHLRQYADRTLLAGADRAENGTVMNDEKRVRASR
jgi:hypothetical protein